MASSRSRCVFRTVLSHQWRRGGRESAREAPSGARAGQIQSDPLCPVVVRASGRSRARVTSQTTRPSPFAPALEVRQAGPVCLWSSGQARAGARSAGRATMKEAGARGLRARTAGQEVRARRAPTPRPALRTPRSRTSCLAPFRPLSSAFTGHRFAFASHLYSESDTASTTVPLSSWALPIPCARARVDIGPEWLG